MTSARYPALGKVLDDRVEDDGVEIALRQPLGDVRGLGEQLDPITPFDSATAAASGPGCR